MSSPYNPMDPLLNDDTESVPCVNREDYDRCNFCGTKLLYNHDLNLPTFEVVETSRCPGCGVTLSPKKFKLH